MGTFRITLSSEGKATPAEVNSGCIKKAGIIFTPAARLVEMLRNLKFQKV